MEQTGVEDGLEERLELSLLYDFYGALLKENQKRMFEAFILEDYNFTEIAEDEGISRQGVFDAVKRATRQLREYEEKLGLAAKFDRQKGLVQKLRQELWELKGAEESRKPLAEGRWEIVFGILSEILEESE